MKKLTQQEIQDRLGALPGWTPDQGAIRRQYTFKSFPDAIAYVTRLAFDAQEADHHPDLQISYRKVTVTWSTHDAGGLTAKDFDGARQSDMIASHMAAGDKA
ncbi:MAG TPA: 4a-hydroxytetrahydrobiopterin dehydratase [Vicinamibacterales bacterium]|nr:4a-hydroxytetrahydrobiopterin dehydratase [Vicinamibacterales bacterium]